MREPCASLRRFPRRGERRQPAHVSEGCFSFSSSSTCSSSISFTLTLVVRSKESSFQGGFKVDSQHLKEIETWNLGALLDSGACDWLSERELQGFRWGKKLFVLLKMRAKITSEQKADSVPRGWFGECLLLSATCFAVTLSCAVLSPPLRSRDVLETRRSPVRFLQRPGLSRSPIQQIFIEVTASLPSSPANLSFPLAGLLLLAVNGGKETLAAPYHRRNGKVVSSHNQDFRIFLLMHFLFPHSVSFFFPPLLSPSFFPLLFIPACPLSFSRCRCFSFPFSPSLFFLPTAFLSRFSFYLHVSPLFLPLAFLLLLLDYFFPSSAFLYFILSSLRSLPPPNHLAVLRCCII